MKYSLDDLSLIVLNAGYAVHEKDWNWENVCSPFARLYYVTSGFAQIQTESGIVDLHPGKMYIVPSFVQHTNICTSHFEHYYLHVYEEGLSADRIFEEYDFPCEVEPGVNDLYLFQRICELNPLASLPQSNPLSYDNQPTLVKNVRLNKMRRFQDKVESRGILYILVSRFLAEAKPKPSASDDRIRNILNYIRKNIGAKITLEELAEMSCLSKDHFIRVFKKETGTTPNQYITRMKVERAMVMLATGDTPVKTIALMLGYDDHSYFNRTFKKETGVTPQQYRDNR